MSLTHLQQIIHKLEHSPIMPLLFLGHGSPMNAIEKNQFTQNWEMLGSQLPEPQAILCISAHWETSGTQVTAMERPRTIHDFYGFPQALYDVEYPAKGHPVLAQNIQQQMTQEHVQLDHEWGLDHGAWSVIMHLYPEADIPVLQLSLDMSKPPQAHYDLAKELAVLRSKGVLIIGSGNMVHNLRMMDWQQPDAEFPWAAEARNTIKMLIAERNHQRLIHYEREGDALALAIPTAEHYLPLLYLLALQGNDEDAVLFNDQPVMGSLAMTSVLIG